MVETFTFGQVGPDTLTSCTVKGDGSSAEFETGLANVSKYWVASLDPVHTVGLTNGTLSISPVLGPGEQLTVCVQHS